MNILDGWKKMTVTAGGVAALGLDAIPDKLVWPYVVLLSVSLVAFAAQDVAKAWKGGK